MREQGVVHFNGKINLSPLLSLYVNSEGNSLLRFLNFDLWGYLSEKYKISPKRKLKWFVILSIILSLLLEILIRSSIENIPRNINSFQVAIFTLLWVVGIMINSKVFYKIKSVYIWELIIAVLIIISSFTVVTPIKYIFYPETRVFGVLNGGIVIFGIFILFYGLREYKVIIPYGILYGILIVLDLLWNVLGTSILGKYMAIISSNLAYKALKILGYTVFLKGTTITIISINGVPISATVAGLCSGIEGITFSIVVLVLLFMGSYITYRWRFVAIIGASLVIFLLNILRIILIFIFAYNYGQVGLEEAHAWLGDIIFLIFIIPYWYLIDKKLNIYGDKNEDTS